MSRPSYANVRTYGGLVSARARQGDSSKAIALVPLTVRRARLLRERDALEERLAATEQRLAELDHEIQQVVHSIDLNTATLPLQQVSAPQPPVRLAPDPASLPAVDAAPPPIQLAPDPTSLPEADSAPPAIKLAPAASAPAPVAASARRAPPRRVVSRPPRRLFRKHQNQVDEDYVDLDEAVLPLAY